MLLSMQSIIDKNYPLDHILTNEDKQALLNENEFKNFSYFCLLNEMLYYKDVTVESLLHGWGGVKLFDLKEYRKEVN